MYTVGPLIKDTPYSGHNTHAIYKGQVFLPKMSTSLYILISVFSTFEKRTPLY